MKTYLELKTQIRNAIWPDSEGENQISAHNLAFEEAMGHIQTCVPCYQEFNNNVHRFCNTLFRCGLTVIDKPDGIIRRIYTIANDNWCDPVIYRQKDWPEPEKFARALLDYTTPLNVGLPKLPRGFYFAEATSDMDSVCGRAREGIWAIYQNRIWIYPWIQSNEKIVVEWEGVKKEWDDADMVDDGIEFRTCVKYYVQFAHERDFGSFSESSKFKKLYDDKLADLIHECREKTRRRNDLDYEPLRSPLPEEIEDDAVPDTESITFAHIGNYATNTGVEEQVAQLVRSWFPDFILASGKNTVDGSNYDGDVGQYFHDFIYPYTGVYGNGAAKNMFWPAPGFFDWQAGDNDLAAYKEFFQLPNNERYYEIVRGDVHLFFIDTDIREPDGITSGSTQGAWLQAKLALSTSVWKVVIMSRPPYSSANGALSVTDLQWPFESWGANLVVAGEAGIYERINVGGIQYLVNGLGSHTKEDIIAPVVTGSQFQYNEQFGALKFTASATALTVQFWDRYSNLIDTLELTA